MEFLVQIDGTFSDHWQLIQATNREAAALAALRKAKNPAKLLPCTVYVSLGNMRHENGTPMAVQAYKIQAAVKS